MPKEDLTVDYPDELSIDPMIRILDAAKASASKESETPKKPAFNPDDLPKDKVKAREEAHKTAVSRDSSLRTVLPSESSEVPSDFGSFAAAFENAIKTHTADKSSKSPSGSSYEDPKATSYFLSHDVPDVNTTRAAGYARSSNGQRALVFNPADIPNLGAILSDESFWDEFTQLDLPHKVLLKPLPKEKIEGYILEHVPDYNMYANDRMLDPSPDNFAYSWLESIFQNKGDNDFYVKGAKNIFYRDFENYFPQIIDHYTPSADELKLTDNEGKPLFVGPDGKPLKGMEYLFKLKESSPDGLQKALTLYTRAKIYAQLVAAGDAIERGKKFHEFYHKQWRPAESDFSYKPHVTGIRINTGNTDDEGRSVTMDNSGQLIWRDQDAGDINPSAPGTVFVSEGDLPKERFNIFGSVTGNPYETFEEALSGQTAPYPEDDRVPADIYDEKDYYADDENHIPTDDSHGIAYTERPAIAQDTRFPVSWVLGTNPLTEVSKYSESPNLHNLGRNYFDIYGYQPPAYTPPSSYDEIYSALANAMRGFDVKANRQNAEAKVLETLFSQFAKHYPEMTAGLSKDDFFIPQDIMDTILSYEFGSDPLVGQKLVADPRHLDALHQIFGSGDGSFAKQAVSAASNRLTAFDNLIDIDPLIEALFEGTGKSLTDPVRLSQKGKEFFIGTKGVDENGNPVFVPSPHVGRDAHVFKDIIRLMHNGGYEFLAGDDEDWENIDYDNSGIRSGLGMTKDALVKLIASAMSDEDATRLFKFHFPQRFNNNGVADFNNLRIFSQSLQPDLDTGSLYQQLKNDPYGKGLASVVEKLVKIINARSSPDNNVTDAQLLFDLADRGASSTGKAFITPEELEAFNEYNAGGLFGAAQDPSQQLLILDQIAAKNPAYFSRLVTSSLVDALLGRDTPGASAPVITREGIESSTGIPLSAFALWLDSHLSGDIDISELSPAAQDIIRLLATYGKDGIFNNSALGKYAGDRAEILGRLRQAFDYGKASYGDLPGAKGLALADALARITDVLKSAFSRLAPKSSFQGTSFVKRLYDTFPRQVSNAAKRVSNSIIKR